MKKYFYQVSVNTPEEAAEYVAYMEGRGYDVDVDGPYDIAMHDLTDVTPSPGTLVRARNVYVVTGTTTTA